MVKYQETMKGISLGDDTVHRGTNGDGYMTMHLSIPQNRELNDWHWVEAN